MIGITDDLFDGVDTAPGGLDDPDDMGDSLGLTDEQLMPPPFTCIISSLISQKTQPQTMNAKLFFD